MSGAPTFHFWTMHWIGGRCYASRHAADGPAEARRAHDAACGWHWVPRDATDAHVTSLFAETANGIRAISGDRRRREPGPAPDLSIGDLTLEPPGGL